MLAWSSNISIIFIVNTKIALFFETEMLNWTASEESLQRVGRFFIKSTFVVSAVISFMRSFWDQCCNSTFELFSTVMILLAFLSCFLVFFFLRLGPNSIFSIKANSCVFEPRVRCVYLFHCVIATEFDYGVTTGSEYCMQLIVWTLNMNYGQKK